MAEIIIQVREIETGGSYMIEFSGPAKFAQSKSDFDAGTFFDYGGSTINESLVHESNPEGHNKNFARGPTPAFVKVTDGGPLEFNVGLVDEFRVDNGDQVFMKNRGSVTFMLAKGESRTLELGEDQENGGSGGTNGGGTDKSGFIRNNTGLVIVGLAGLGYALQRMSDDD